MPMFVKSFWKPLLIASLLNCEALFKESTLSTSSNTRNYKHMFTVAALVARDQQTKGVRSHNFFTELGNHLKRINLGSPPPSLTWLDHFWY